MLRAPTLSLFMYNAHITLDEEYFMEQKVLMPGEMAGNYDEKWTKTFDLQFLILWLGLFAILSVWTVVADPHLFDARKFFLMTGIKLFVMMILALGGGLLCRHYCHVDEKGYITTSKMVGLRLTIPVKFNTLRRTWCRY